MVEDVSGRLRVGVLGPLRVWLDDREAPLTPNGLSIVISQSGETADTLAS